MEYFDFLNEKTLRFTPSGFDVKISELTDCLFDYQKALVAWALKKGKSAIFADTGLGKTFIEVEWAWQVFQRTGNRVLIVAPLSVAEQTVIEAKKMNQVVYYEREFVADGRTGIYITNYEMLDKFEWAIKNNYFDGVVLDESSVIKHRDSKTRNYIIDLFKDIPYKLSATATPSPNDYMELGNQAEFLGVMSMSEMLSMFFIHDSGETSKWRLKGHGGKVFWQWMAHWAVMMEKPSDIGFSDDGFEKPSLIITEEVVQSEFKIEDNSSLQGRNEARKLSTGERVKRASEIMNESDEQWVVWCHLNDESNLLKNSINGSIEVKGSDKPEHKRSRIVGFQEGEHRVMVTKPSIAGFGLNWQHCKNMVFVGLNDSFEEYYQAIRRCWRFGQKNEVRCHIITSSLEGPVRDNLLEKEARASEMKRAMIAQMKDFTTKEVHALKVEKTEYFPDVEMILPDFLEVA